MGEKQTSKFTIKNLTLSFYFFVLLCDFVMKNLRILKIEKLCKLRKSQFTRE